MSTHASAQHSDGFYLHQWLRRLQDLETRLAAQLPDTSLLPARAKSLRTQVAQALISQGDAIMDELLENIFLPQLDRLIQDARQALGLTQHAKKSKNIMLTPRKARLLELSASPVELPEVPLFQGSESMRRDPNNREKIEEAMKLLREFIGLDHDK